MKIQRDSWSATKYALRLAQVFERQYLIDRHQKSDWDDILAGYNGKDAAMVSNMYRGSGTSSRMIIERKGAGYYGRINH